MLMRTVNVSVADTVASTGLSATHLAQDRRSVPGVP
jgi:hypothetical protein